MLGILSEVVLTMELLHNYLLVNKCTKFGASICKIMPRWAEPRRHTYSSPPQRRLEAGWKH